MRQILIIAGKEIRDGLRNRWVAAATLLLAGLALSLAFLGSAPVGNVGVDHLAVTVVGLSSLTIYLIPLIALLLSFDAVVGETERGTLFLLLSYPVSRKSVLLGKAVGHLAIMAFATVAGYGSAGVALALTGQAGDAESWHAFASMIGSSVLLGGAFLALGYLISTLVRERATAAGVAVIVWLAFVLLYDLGLLALLIADRTHVIGPHLFAGLLLANPADTYRLYNLASFESVSALSGLAGVAAKAGDRKSVV